jgi:outer membrane lipoprotein-sorting protein
MKAGAALKSVFTTVCLAVLALASLSATPAGETPTGEQVLERIDENMFFDKAVVMAKMVVHGRTGSRTIESKSWRRGEDSVLVEYLAPARERGKKMLKLGNQIWNYIPEPTDRIIAISGHLLKQSVMGSDLSYEDVTENHRLRDIYESAVADTQTVAGRLCLVLELTAKVSDVAYHSRKVWVDDERWLPLREERYAKSGKLLKTTQITEVFELGDGWYPKRMVFRDELSKSGGTEYLIDSVDLEAEVPEYLLTKAALRK